MNIQSTANTRASHCRGIWSAWVASVIDNLGTALGFGLDAEDLEGTIHPFKRDALYAPDDAGAERFLSLLNSWIEMTMVLNELARSVPTMRRH